MSIPLRIWKRLIPKQFPLSCNRPSIAISLPPSLPFYAKPHIKFANLFGQMAITSPTPPDRGVVTDFLISKCSFKEEDITISFRSQKRLLRRKSAQNMEEVLELLKGCGLTTPAQIRRVVRCNPNLLFLRSEENVKSKLRFLRTFIKEEDISKLLVNDAKIFSSREDKLKSGFLLLQRLGFEGTALSYLVAMRPCLLKISEKKVVELFKQVENLGFKKESKMFAAAVSVFLGVGEKKIERKLECLRTLGFSEKQISQLSRREPRSVLASTVEKLNRSVDFAVNSMGLLLADLVKYPHMFRYSLEKRMIPRYKVMEALNSMQVQGLKRKKCIPETFKLTEKCFLEKYVNNNLESSILLDIYHGRKVAKVIIDNETGSERVSIKKVHGSSQSSS